MKESPLRLKSEKFAARIVRLSKYLSNDKKESTMSKQILRSGTSIGANIAEAGFANSKKDFIAKLRISIKECSETLYWLKLLKDSDFLTEQQFESINEDCKELGRILNQSIRTAKINLEKEEKQ